MSRVLVWSGVLLALCLAVLSAVMTQGAGVLAWLARPISGATEHAVSDQVAWHARLMVLAWGVLLPLGALAARFFKVMPGQDWPTVLDNKTWWHAHRVLQYSGIVAMSVGVVLIWNQGEVAVGLQRLHVWLGWSVCLAGWLQVAGGLARGSKGGPTEARLRGDHYDMTPWRITFERVHKATGWLAIALSIPTVLAGLVLVDAPRWMLLLLLSWWVVLTLLFVQWQRHGRCIDTYQAIWGADASVHPGLRIPPVGWGVRRYTASAWRQRFMQAGSDRTDS